MPMCVNVCSSLLGGLWLPAGLACRKTVAHALAVNKLEPMQTINLLTVCFALIHVLQAASTAARAELEAKNTLLHSELKTAQDACAEANGNLQRAHQEHEFTVQSLQEKHTAAAAALQVQLSDHQQQLLAAQAKAEEDSAAAAAADQKIQELCGKINTYDLKQKGVGLHVCHGMA